MVPNLSYATDKRILETSGVTVNRKDNEKLPGLFHTLTFDKVQTFCITNVLSFHQNATLNVLNYVALMHVSVSLFHE